MVRSLKQEIPSERMDLDFAVSEMFLNLSSIDLQTKNNAHVNASQNFEYSNTAIGKNLVFMP